MLTYNGKTTKNAVTKTISQMFQPAKIVLYVDLNVSDLGTTYANHRVNGSNEIEIKAHRLR